MGLLFQAKGANFWNLVDTEIDEDVVSYAKAQAGTIDLLAAPYQPLIERDLWADSLGGAFPHERYGRLLRQVLDVEPRCVVPGSCGFRYSLPWMNDRGFPITEEQFLEDLSRLEPGLLAVTLPPGGTLEVGRSIHRSKRRLPFVRLTSGSATPSHDWRPDRGVPPLVDTNPVGHSVRYLRTSTNAYLEGPFLEEIASPSNLQWRSRLARLGVVWKLEVVYPDKTVDTRMLDFRNLKYLVGSAKVFCKLQTSVAASSVVGAVQGEQNAYSSMLGLGAHRVVVRLYDAHRGGVMPAGDATDDPLAKILFASADERFIEAELKRLGY